MGEKLYRRGVFVFRRDLRLTDNTGLLRALSECAKVIPAFILDPRQCVPDKNPYFSVNAFSFLLSSLRDVEAMLQARSATLRIFQGDPSEILRSLIVRDHVDAVYVNADHTPFSRARDEALARVCSRHGAVFVSCGDLTLAPVETILTKTGVPYSVFTPFMRAAQGHSVPAPRKNVHRNYYRGPLHSRTVRVEDIETHSRTRGTHAEAAVSPFTGGRRAGLKLLRTFKGLITTYDTR